MTVIAVFNQKGGVGKTTVTANLAATLVQNGIAPLVIDLDPQAHLTATWGLNPKSNQTMYRFYQGTSPLTDLIQTSGPGIHFIPSHLELARVDSQLGKHRDHLWRLKLALEAEMLAGSGTPIIIDCSPMLGVLSFSALLAADLILIPVAAEYLALNGACMLERTLFGLEKFDRRRERRYLVNRFKEGHETHEKVRAQLQKHFPRELLNTIIHENDDIMAAVGDNLDVFSYAPDSSAGTDFSFLLDELIEKGLIGLEA
ncbi:ParA family protein [Chitinibacter sp. FCG-7]|uniref:ParA family protein n=1 Tax=Chitinibacter mangrovi TaxID=3153927 RepID=A0AAU7FBV3_9NEIS